MFNFIKIVLSATAVLFLSKLVAHGAPTLSSSSLHDVQNDQIQSTVIDMNSSNVQALAIFSKFNLSMEDVQRRVSRIDDSNSGEGDASSPTSSEV